MQHSSRERTLDEYSNVQNQLFLLTYPHVRISSASAEKINVHIKLVKMNPLLTVEGLNASVRRVWPQKPIVPDAAVSKALAV